MLGYSGCTGRACGVAVQAVLSAWRLADANLETLTRALDEMAQGENLHRKKELHFANNASPRSADVLMRIGSRKRCSSPPEEPPAIVELSRQSLAKLGTRWSAPQMDV